MTRVIEHLSVSDNIRNLSYFMLDFNIKPFCFKIQKCEDYFSISQVLMKLGFSRETHWEELMLNKLFNGELEKLYLNVNCLGFSLFSSRGFECKEYKNVRDFIMSNDYFKLTQRDFININD